MTKKIKTITALEKYILLAEFENGESRRYDLSRIIDEIDAFKTLTIVNGLFEQVKVCCGGHGICWNDYIDLSCEELYEKGVSV